MLLKDAIGLLKTKVIKNMKYKKITPEKKIVMFCHSRPVGKEGSTCGCNTS